MPEADVVIVGAGAAGLSAAAALKRKGIEAVVLEQNPRVGGTWARRYDRLHLHTVRGFSGLAHYGIPRRFPKYLSRDDFVSYLNEYAEHFGLRIIADCSAQKIAKDARVPEAWKISTTGDTWRARAVVIATGQYRIPIPPRWPGVDIYKGQLLHSESYSKPSPFAGKRVLVVGAGNSGTEIATDVAENGAAFVALSIRTAPAIVPRDPFGMPVQRTGILLNLLPAAIADRFGRLTSRIVLGDLTKYGFRRAEWGPFSSKRVPVIDVGFVKALKQGLVQIRPALVRLTATDAVFADGSAQPFDAIIAATGFSTGLDQLLDAKEALNELAEPKEASGNPTACPGLFFIGFTHSLRGHLFEANLASRRLAKNVGRYLQKGALRG